MITQNDIKKLKTIFPTKEDLKNELSAYATKDYLKNELKGFATKADLQKSTGQLVDLINGGFSRFDKMMSKLVDHDAIIEDHEKRIDVLEQKIVLT
ncbi:MAG: hypothetical protein UR68_C0027G0011 [Candidatus Roizmanbacteria bacterium GW2011_GWA2_35_19]|uniref:Uncharacterized protein n=2 Tax=Candidatus Roizmaniibacteriota TaxID=1752723 RepID=A0A0G0C6J2_9BACT|nr:MAG: hypothetical protein UR63_C0043G0005 [Candidatus Roizmanbacteria bacterium GW2011_GWC2_35_12]KKP71776.1 MAG: hypothetical protein UR68_C0027G0011 [Candidatus Roizmanbacteria bacterium GW2011_GWA2_35_19]